MKTVSTAFKQLLAASITGSFLLAAALPSAAQEFEQNPRPDSFETIQAVKELSRDVTPPSSDYTAYELAETFINWAVDAGHLDTGRGWNDQAGVYVAIGTDNYMTDNPATDQNFAQMRAMRFLTASLHAKDEIIDFVGMELYFESTLPFHESWKADIKERLRLRFEHVLSSRRLAIDLLYDMIDERLSNVSFEDLLHHGLGGLIETPIPPDFTIEPLQDHVREVLADMIGFEVETLPAMTLIGPAMVRQFETWDDFNGFEIAVVYMWAPEQEVKIHDIFAEP